MIFCQAQTQIYVRINHEVNVKLTPEHDKPIYAQSLPSPINLKDDLTIELAKLWAHHHTALPKVQKPYFRAEEIER